MFQSKTIEKAVEYAILHHGDQKRLFENTPYVLHCLRVAQLASQIVTHGNREFVMQIGLFHDILEDTPVLEEEMRVAWGNRVTDAVVELTKLPPLLTLTDSISRYRYSCKEEQSRLRTATHFAKIVKLADIFDNVQCVTAKIAETDPEWTMKMLIKKKALLEVIADSKLPMFYHRAVALTTSTLDNHSPGWESTRWARVAKQ